MTIQKMRTLILGAKNEIKDADRSFEVDAAFLDNYAHPMLVDALKEKFLAKLPSAEKMVELEDCKHALEALRDTEEVEAAGQNLIDEFDAALKILMNLAIGSGGSGGHQHEATSSSFYKSVLARSAFFFSYEMEVKDKEDDTVKLAKVGGTDAVKACFEQVKAKFDAKEGEYLSQKPIVKKLKAFQWVLDQGQRDSIAEWIRLMADEDNEGSVLSIVPVKEAQKWMRQDDAAAAKFRKSHRDCQLAFWSDTWYKTLARLNNM